MGGGGAWDLVLRAVCKKFKEQAGISMKGSRLIGMLEVVTGRGWRQGLVGTVMVTRVVRVEEVEFLAWDPFQDELPPLPPSVWRANAGRCAEISESVIWKCRGVKNSRSMLD